MTPISLKNLQEEIRVLSNLPASDHIIRLHETIKTKNHFYLIVDYCNGGDLESVLEQRLILKEREVQIIFRQVLKAIKVMRDLKVIHRDIKNANILLHFPYLDKVDKLQYTQTNLSNAERVEVKLADFGFSQILKNDELVSVQCGTPLHMAPEILNGHPYNYKADMYSFGVSIFEALMGVTPFFGKDKKDLTRNVNTGLVRIPKNIDISSCCLDFIMKCLLFDSKDRISIDHALNHPFINPDSPQYMDKISLKPLVPALKTCSHLTTFNISIKPSFSYFGGNLLGENLGVVENQDKYSYIDVHEGRILDEDKLMKLFQGGDAQKIQESYEEQAKKNSSELRAGQYFQKSNEVVLQDEHHQYQPGNILNSNLAGTYRNIEIESGRVENEVQSKGSKKDVLQFRDIKAKISKHLLEDKIQRRLTLEILYKNGQKPQDMETDQSFSYLSERELQSLKNIIQLSANSPHFMRVDEVALQEDFLKELLGLSNDEYLPNLQQIVQIGHPQTEQPPEIINFLLEVNDEDSVTSSYSSDEEQKNLRGRATPHSADNKPNLTNKIEQQIEGIERFSSKDIYLNDNRESSKNQNSDLTFQNISYKQIERAEEQNKNQQLLNSIHSSVQLIKQNGQFNYNQTQIIPVSPLELKERAQDNENLIIEEENGNQKIINIFNNCITSPLNSKQAFHYSLRQMDGEEAGQDEELKLMASMSDDEDAYKLDFHPSELEEDQDAQKCELIVPNQNKNFEGAALSNIKNNNPNIGDHIDVSSEAPVASERRQIRQVPFRTDAMIMKMRSRLIENNDSSKDILQPMGTYLFGSSLVHNESREFKVTQNPFKQRDKHLK